MRPGSSVLERTHSSDLTSSKQLEVALRPAQGDEREEDIYRSGDDLYRFCIPRGVGAEGEEAPLRQHRLLR